MTDLATAPLAPGLRRPRTRRYLMTPPGPFLRFLRHQPVDESEPGHRHRARHAAVGGAPPDLSPARTPGRRGRARAGAAGHGLRGQRCSQYSRSHHRSALRLPAAGGGGRGVRALAGTERARSGVTGRSTSTRARATSSSSALRSWPVPASGRRRQRTPRSPRSPACRSSRWNWSTRASTISTPRWPSLDDETVAYYPGAFSVTSQATLAILFPEARDRRRGRRRGAGPERRVGRPPRRADRGGTSSSAGNWPSAASCRCPSTSPSC